MRRRGAPERRSAGLLQPPPAGNKLRAGSLPLQVVNIEPRFVRRTAQSPLDAFLHSRDQDLVAKPLPAFLRIVHGHDVQSTRRRSGSMKYLDSREAVPAWVHRCKLLFVLALSTAGEVMHDRVSHAGTPFE